MISRADGGAPVPGGGDLVHAQTNLQLYEQVQRLGCSGADLTLIRAAYGLAADLFTGRFQASGKVFTAHVVGTASILAALRLPAAVAAAGLLHNVYRNGDFGDGRSGVSDARRQSVRRAVGEEVEAYVHGFAALPWKAVTMRAARDDHGRFGPVERLVLVMRLADVLEHHVDLGVLHYGDVEARRAFVCRHGALVVDLAGALGFPGLAAGLARAFHGTLSEELPPELRETGGRGRSFVLAPRSFRPRWLATAPGPERRRPPAPPPGIRAGSPERAAVPGAKAGAVYAQTNVQLYRQLQREGYAGPDLCRVRRAYELAMDLFSGLYRPSGKTNLDHVVGTASILASFHAPVAVVAAGLLHPGYVHGDFGGLGPGPSRARRAAVRRAVGPDVEEHVARYAALRSRFAAIPALHAALPALDPLDRPAVLIRLADVLEDHLDRGILYCSDADRRRRSGQRHRPRLTAMAEDLGFPALAGEIARSLDEVASAEVPPPPPDGSVRDGVSLVAPRSYARRSTLALGQRLVRGSRGVGRQLARRLDGVSRRLLPRG